MTPQEVADRVGVPLATVRHWRARGTGPQAARIGKHLKYRDTDVEAWIERQFDQKPADRTAR